MCEALGTEPDPNEMPVDYEDLYYECRQAIDAYNLLPSSWSGGGDYLGKDMTGCKLVFDLLNINSNITEQVQLLQIIDSVVSQDIRRKQKAASTKKVK